MDFQNRVPAQPAAPAHPASAGGSRKNNKVDTSKWGRVGVALLSLLVAVFLVFAIIGVASSSKSNGNESGFVDTSKLQAVFLNTGQVYFGNVKALNNKYIELTNIYYLQTSSNGGSSSSAANTNVSLVKLGCELHEPYDRMIINQNSVTFWENLQDGGQVAKAVKTFEQQNPNGQKCADQSSSSSTNSSSSTQPANNGSGTPSTTSTKP